MGTWASELDHRAMEEGGLIWWIMFSFTSHGWSCVSLTWGTHGTRVHYWKKASWRRQCDALGNVMLGSAIHVDVSLTRTTYLSIIAHHVHPFMDSVFPDGCGLFQQDNVPCHKAKIAQDWFEEHKNEVLVNLTSKFPRSQSNWASVRCAWQTSQIHGGPTFQLTGLIGSAANFLVPDTTAHLQGASGVRELDGCGLFLQ